MKIGVILPIGNLKKFGYQHNHQVVIDNLAHFADELVIVSSTRENPATLGKEYKNVHYISDERTWFEQKEGKEIFTYATLTANLKIALDVLKKDGCDVVMQVHINQYISTEAADNLKKQAAELIKSKEPFAWIYKKYQLAEWLFQADVRVPWMLNLTVDNPYVYDSDAIVNTQSKEMIRIESGNFSLYNNQAVTDILLQYTLEDARDLFLFTQAENLKLSGKTPSDQVEFEPQKWEKYMQYKINAKIRSEEKLDQTGTTLLKNAQENFVCFMFQRKYRPYHQQPLAKIVNTFFKRFK
jgi:hypothetical protein